MGQNRFEPLSTNGVLHRRVAL